MLRERTGLFFHSMLMTLLVLTCAVTCLWFISEADTATRRVGFGDDTPAFSAVSDGEDITVSFFGRSVSASEEKVKELLGSAKESVKSLLPAPIEAIVEWLQSEEGEK